MHYVKNHFPFIIFAIVFSFAFVVMHLVLPSFFSNTLRHPNPSVDAYFETPRVNLYFKVQSYMLFLSLPSAAIAFYAKQQPLSYFSKMNNLSDFILFFYAFIFLMLLSYLLIGLFRYSLFQYHMDHFVHRPEPHNPIIGAFVRCLPHELRSGLEPLDKECFLKSFFDFYASSPPPFSQNVFPSALVFRSLTQLIASFFLVCNLFFFYTAFLSFYAHFPPLAK